MGYVNPDALVSTGWLSDRLEDPDVRPIEVDEDTEAYGRSHIPGAVGWDWSKDLHHGVRRDYVDRDGLAELLRRAGVDESTTVVLYGGNNNWFAAYAYWLMKYRGFDNVRLLDGGRKKWEIENRPLTTERPALESGSIAASGSDRPELRALRDEVLEKLNRATFVDVRSPEEFSGEVMAPPHLPQEQPYVGGHVPGARNIPWARAANEDGSFKSADDLRSLYEGSDVSRDDEIIAYCRIGERAAHTWFALHELLGYENVKNYDGSWTEYGSMVNVPVERGG
ncbi:MAG: sulfurtransferase [Gemmatimonadetes bacterium]|nr:sulfurtransferase [Gemmatimonadota bacterium]